MHRLNSIFMVHVIVNKILWGIKQGKKTQTDLNMVFVMSRSLHLWHNSVAIQDITTWSDSILCRWDTRVNVWYVVIAQISEAAAEFGPLVGAQNLVGATGLANLTTTQTVFWFEPETPCTDIKSMSEIRLKMGWKTVMLKNWARRCIKL